MRKRSEPLLESERARIRVLVDELGERQAAAQLGLEPRTLARALAGLGTYPGTRSLIREHLRHGGKVA